MKKALLFLLILLSFYTAKSQNYQCLQPTVKNFFINSNNYLRGIRIDSVKTYADSIVYFPFHTPRGPYNDYSIPVLDLNGGSWLGKKVIQLSDGTTIFDSYWKDSVIIKTQANVGDSWIFYNDSGSLYYRATVISKDTMTVLSSLDSIKTIRINTFNSSGAVTSDSLDNLTLLLSKNHGFVQVFDLYTFPYHKSDSTYRPGLDFFLDLSLSIAFTKSNLLFKLTNFLNPNEQEMYAWNIGDEFNSWSYSAGYPPAHCLQTVTSQVVSKTTSGHVATYTLTGDTFSPDCPGPYGPTFFIDKAGVYSFNDIAYSILNPWEMPEDHFNDGFYVYYYPDDSSFCSKTPLYIKYPFSYYDFLGYGYPKRYTFKAGIGLVAYYYETGDPWLEDIKLTYYNINGISCGTPLTIKDAQKPLLSITPNPAADELIIKMNTSSAYTIILQNPLGQTVKYLQTHRPEEIINVSGLPTGIYFVNIIDENGNRSSAKVVIQH